MQMVLIYLLDGGTEIATLNNASNNFEIESKVSDADILIKGNDGGSGITALTFDMSEAGNATFNGSVTGASAVFDGGVVVDNITIDGTEIDLSSGNLTLDVDGVIILDADGGNVQLHDLGTEIARFTNNSSDFEIKSMQFQIKI